jgi:hypothetical protein
MDRTSETYRIISKLVNFRKDNRLWTKNQIQRYADDIFYAFSLDDILCVFVNTETYMERTITYHPYKEADRLCNIFSAAECIQVTGGVLKITMGGDFKVYQKSSNYSK